MNKLFLKGINLLEKKIRAQVIKEHLSALGLDKCVCFSCGNSANLLKQEGLNVVYIGENGVLKPNKWFSPDEIQSIFNGLFDATSGNLSEPLMEKISYKLTQLDEIKKLYPLFEGNYFFDRSSLEQFYSDKKDVAYLVPTGSGETITCLKKAYPSLTLIPVRILGNANTQFHEECNLNQQLVSLFGTANGEVLQNYSQPD